jgi:hypothetical protein
LKQQKNKQSNYHNLKKEKKNEKNY